MDSVATQRRARRRQRLEQVIARGNRPYLSYVEPDLAEHTRRGRMRYDNRRMVTEYRLQHVDCRDGFRLSVIAGWGTFCRPTPALGRGQFWRRMPGYVAHDYAGPYSHVEVGLWSPHRPPPEWGWNGDPSSGGRLMVYKCVPVDEVRRLVALHGGERAYRVQIARAKRVWRATRRVHRRCERRRKRKGNG